MTHPTDSGVLTPAARDVLAERQRQISEEGSPRRPHPAHGRLT